MDGVCDLCPAILVAGHEQISQSASNSGLSLLPDPPGISWHHGDSVKNSQNTDRGQKSHFSGST